MTSDERRKLYAALATPFPEEAIERTDGKVTGKGYSTTGIKYQYVANRLNEVLGVGGWRAHRTVNVKEITRSNGRPAFEAVADVTLELGEWVDGVFEVFAESLADGGHVATSEADARKGAFTGAWKKAAGMLGVGRQAYEGSLDDDNVPADTGIEIPTNPANPPRPTPPAQPQQVNVTTLPTAPAQQRNRLSSKQLGAIQAIGRKLGFDPQGLRAHIKKTLGVQPEFLSRDLASKLISAMSAQAGNGHDTGHHQAEPGAEG
ncbi:MAG: hypothetical protein HY901_08005 [Deltaproteobacteria bacterium]|nr:hypothetical protein [Deltaproteobacteria bacterium]